MCQCGARNFYDEELEDKGVAQTCWHCVNTIKAPVKLFIGKSRLVLYSNSKLYRHHIYGDYDMETVVGEVVQNPNNPSIWGVKNEDTGNWTYEQQDGKQIPIEVGRSARVASGAKIIFSESVGEFK